MKLLLGISLGLGMLVGGIALSQVAANRSMPAPQVCAAGDCGKKGQPCSGSVICCPGLNCVSSSGGDPICQ